MVSPQAKREAVLFLKEQLGFSERLACGLVGQARSSQRYCSTANDNALLRERLVALAGIRKRFGYRRLHILLKREGFSVNHKRLYRLYKQEELSVRKRKRKRTAVTERNKALAPERANIRWSMDFVHDSLANGRRLRCLTIVDDYTRESLAIEVDHSLPARRVCRVLDRLASIRGLPQSIVIDNGPEFAGKVLDHWAYTNKVTLHFITPGRPVENAYIESFNGKFRDECLNENWFTNLSQARALIEAWRQDYNTIRPHSSLNYQTPQAFADAHAFMRTGGAPLHALASTNKEQYNQQRLHL